MILSQKLITKSLIRLHGCAGWSAPLLFAAPEDRFSREEVRQNMCIYKTQAPEYLPYITIVKIFGISEYNVYASDVNALTNMYHIGLVLIFVLGGAWAELNCCFPKRFSGKMLQAGGTFHISSQTSTNAEVRIFLLILALIE